LQAGIPAKGTGRMIKNNQISISGAVVFRDNRGRRQYFLVKQSGGKDWEIPKVAVRRGESSVRAVLRMIGEQAGINARILEEAGRGTGSVVVNGKTVPQKHYYYLLMQRAGGEVLGFDDYRWVEYAKALRLIFLKKEKGILRSAREVLTKWEKERSKMKLSEG
jgi:8-oxo-dGTP pyrophosphatase MutT (NUDIX family)